MRRVAVVQARMTSTRLPGKVLKDVGGSPMLAQQLRRLKHCEMLDVIVVATTRNTTDDPVAKVACAEGVEVFRGDEHDVLSRYVGAAREFGADVVVRLTADCPLIAPELADAVVSGLTSDDRGYDYSSNVLRRTYPKGLDTEAMYADILFRIDRLARSAEAREHVTGFLRFDHPELFLCRSVTDSEDNSDLRWTVDETSDLEFVRRLFQEMNLSSAVVPYRKMLSFVRAHPEICAINAGLAR
jgi:spore coat polysaccharide biosynthesis protein SpsF